MFDHVKFGVRDYAASKSFFLKSLEPLGVAVVSEGPPTYGVELSQKDKASLCLYQTEEKPAHLQLAFTAENRQQVAAFYRAALDAGGKDNGAPGLRPHNANARRTGDSLMHAASAGFLALVGAILASTGVCQAAAPPQREPTALVVFVCEHGNVKSLIAASHFERVAKERGLPFRAVSRGLSPESDVPPSIVDALRSDGVDVAGFKPQPLTPSDISTASHVIAIGVDLSTFVHEEQVSTELWSDVPRASVDYAASRAALLRHIDVLLDKLQQKP